MSIDQATDLVVHRHVERAEVEEVVAVGLDVLVEQDRVGGALGGRAAVVDRVVHPLGGGGDVPPGSELDRGRHVGLLHPRSDLAEDRLDRVGVGREEPLGGGVLGSEVVEQGRVVDVAHPGVRIVDVAGRSMPGVLAPRCRRRRWCRCVGCLVGLFAHGRANVDSQRYRSVTMRVWIDQDLCTGDGLCVDHCPDVFVLLEDGIAYVVEERRGAQRSGRLGQPCLVSERNVADTIHAAELCPGECIFIEVEVPSASAAATMSRTSSISPTTR